MGSAVTARRIGILGGTFDPIHVGHLAIAEFAREELGLERVDFIPAGTPQLRPSAPTASAGQRAAMVELAIRDNPHFGMDRIEVDRTGPTFAVDTLEALAARAAGDPRPDLWFILSAQALLGLPSWKTPVRVLELARLAVVPRPGTDTPDRDWVEANFPGCGDRVKFIAGPRLEISATDVRELLRRGRSVRYLVPDAVIAYIRDHGLYRS